MLSRAQLKLRQIKLDEMEENNKLNTVLETTVKVPVEAPVKVSVVVPEVVPEVAPEEVAPEVVVPEVVAPEVVVHEVVVPEVVVSEVEVSEVNDNITSETTELIDNILENTNDNDVQVNKLKKILNKKSRGRPIKKAEESTNSNDLANYLTNVD